MLTHLQNITLVSDGLTGTIPDLSQLSSLTYVDLNNNQLSGPLPALNVLPLEFFLPAIWRTYLS